MIPDGVLQDALKQHRPFFGRLVCIALGQSHHGVLHDIERGVFVLNGIVRLLECAAFYLGQKCRELVRPFQNTSPWRVNPNPGDIGTRHSVN